jgi:hypothetical protein
MVLAYIERSPEVGAAAVPRGDVRAERPYAADEVVGVEPFILNPAELRQLRQDYRDLLELHRAEVVDDEDFEDAHRLLVEQVLPLRDILRHHDHLVVSPKVDLTY